MLRVQARNLISRSLALVGRPIPSSRRNGTPRQPGLARAARSRLQVTWGNHPAHTTAGLEAFSHVWLLFVFHNNRGDEVVKSKAKPPRLGGAPAGIFGCRTPHRPNPIGLSLVQVARLSAEQSCSIASAGRLRPPPPPRALLPIHAACTTSAPPTPATTTPAARERGGRRAALAWRRPHRRHAHPRREALPAIRRCAAPGRDAMPGLRQPRIRRSAAGRGPASNAC